MLKDDYPVVRRAAVQALSVIGTEQDGGTIVEALGDEDEDVRRAVVISLGIRQEHGAVEELGRLLGDDFEDAELRVEAAEALGTIGGQRALEFLRIAASSELKPVRMAAENVLQRSIPVSSV